MVKGYDLTFAYSERRGRMILPNKEVRSCPAAVRHARESSLGVKGAQVFNLLPASLRNINSKQAETFKTSLDKFLSKVPDQPTVGGLVRASESNSLLHQIPMMNTTLT